METLRQDIRHAARTLWKSRGFAIVAMATLALGIGASTAIFSVIDNVLLEPFPYKDANRLMSVEIHDADDSTPNFRSFYSSSEFLDYTTQNHVFEGAIGMSQDDILYSPGE